MAAFPVYDVDDLANFTGRDASSFMDFVDEALSQALFIVQERTQVYDYPLTARLQRAFKYAILDVADSLHTERMFDFDRIRANPFASENKASYSYSKSQALQKALMSDLPTGLKWLDILLAILLGDSYPDAPSGGSTHIFENDDVYLVNDERWVLGPRDVSPYPQPIVDYGYPDPSSGYQGGSWVNETPESEEAGMVIGLYSGEGPPDESLVLPEGSTYLDLLTGIVYKDI